MTATQLWQNLELRSREVGLCRRANHWGARRAIARFFGVISRLGDGVFWYVLMLAIAIFGGIKGVHVALQMALTGIVAASMYRGLKRWTRRPRPFRTHQDIVPLVLPLDEFSFPSGHTLHAVTFTIVALAYFPWLAPLLIPFALLVAASRVVLGLHYPSDVLAATLIGCGLACTSLWVTTLLPI
ncbi:MAG: phosphatase PAP2 family protein [Rudaea sp.]|uniref:phosphatase PAP2 family protein n=1 Tax=unclassified Rudaea TaxID=2627037 RepID=UPI0010F4A646|nr:MULTISPECIES: phosphatase PAP2 family protein [unclassified Rudaea]MBN8887731.1 phosphatase PAP2 family protein [Rudaea sp.]MBR0346808.1 phosphatase PAP2 family protein [Rudaea sp.]